MESLVSSIISKYLKIYVNNFHKEQVSMNFLRGHGVIRDLDLNVDAINDLLMVGSPGLRFTRIMINTLSIQAPIMSLKRKPIIFFIDEIFIEIAETVEISKKAGAEGSPEAAGDKKNNSSNNKPSQTKYGFLDRIVDSMSFEINRIIIGFRALGRAKSTEVGDWTPPVLLLEFFGNRFYCTTNNGVEAELDECFRVRPTSKPILFIYKRCDITKASVHLINPDVWFQIADELILGGGIKEALKRYNVTTSLSRPAITSHRDYTVHKLIENLPVCVDTCMRKRLSSNILLGLEISINFNVVKLIIKQEVLSELLSFGVSLLYCFLREDVVEEIYGPDPHNECKNDKGDDTTKIAAISKSLASIASPMATPGRHVISRDQLEAEELASLDLLDAEMERGGATIADEKDSWQRSSLNGDSDPPHLRFVLSVQANEMVVTMPLDSIKPPPDAAQRAEGEQTARDSSRPQQMKGVIFTVLGLVHSSIWPEHASITESVIQSSARNFSIQEYLGVKKTCLLRPKNTLESMGRPVFISLLPRGVKESGDQDPENQPGVCFLYRKESNWPPPPIGKGTAINSEVCLSPLEITVKVDIFSDIVSCAYGCWDPRWVTGQWGQANFRRLDKMHDTGSAETTVILNGLDVKFYPILNEMATTASKIILPAELMLEVGHISLLWKSSLDMNFFLNLLQPSSTGARQQQQQRRSITPTDLPDPDEDNDIFITSKFDLSNSIQFSRPIPGINLLNGRFEALISEIVISIADDYYSDRVAKKDSSTGASAPRTRPLMKPFSITYFQSLDPHPLRDPIIPTSSLSKTPYNREYYWKPNSSVIQSTYLGVDDVCAELSLLDLVKVLQTVDALKDIFLDSDAYRWTRAKIGLEQEFTVFPQSSGSAASSHSTALPPEQSSELPSYLSAIRIRNLTFSIIKAHYAAERTGQSSSDGEDDDVIAVISVNNAILTTEKPSGEPQSILVVKGMCSGIVMSACNRPFLFLRCDDLQQTLSHSGSERQDPNKWKNRPVFAFRYENKEASSVDLTQLSQHARSSESAIDSSSPAQRFSELFQLKLLPGTRLVIAPKKSEDFATYIITEFLQGFGAVHANPSEWWEDSVFGYFKYYFGSFISIDGGASPQPHHAHAAGEKGGQPGKAKYDRKVNPIVFKLSSKAFDVLLLETFPSSSKFAGIIISTSKFTGSGSIRFGDDAPLLTLQINILLQLLLHSGNFDGDSKSDEICSPFAFSADILKVGRDPTLFKSSMSLHDIASRMSAEVLQAAKIVMESAVLSGSNVERLIRNFWSLVRSSIPVFNGRLPTSNSALYGLSAHNDLPSTVRLLRTLRPYGSGEKEGSGAVQPLNASSCAAVQLNLAETIAEMLAAQCLQITEAKRILQDSSSNLASALQGTQSLSNQMEQMIRKLKDLTVLSSASYPSHCGWIRRSSGFSKPDKSYCSSRCWGMLVQNSLIFMAKPYAKSYDLEICLDNNILVIDPDKLDLSDASASVSAYIWLVDSSAEGSIFASINSSIFLFDVITLDEKVLWLEALRHWQDTSSEALEVHRQAFAQAVSVFNSKDRLGVGSSEDSIMSVNAQKLVFSDTLSGSIGGSLGASIAATKTMRSMTKGIKKGFSYAGKSLSMTGIAGSLAQAVGVASTPNPSISTPGAGTKSLRRSSLNDSTTAAEDSVGGAPRAAGDISCTSPYPNRIGDGGSPGGTATDYSDMTSADILQELEEMRRAISMQHLTISDNANITQSSYSDVLSLLALIHEKVGKSIMGSLVMRVLSGEMETLYQNHERNFKEALGVLSDQLRQEKRVSMAATQAWGQARQKESELEAVLHACTIQHIYTVQELHTKYDDLEEHYRRLRSIDGAAADKAASLTSTELMKRMSTSVADMALRLSEAEEKAVMIHEDMDAMVVETDYVHRALDSMQEAGRVAAAAHEAEVACLREEIRAQTALVAQHEGEEGSLRAQLACALDVLKSLGVGVENEQS